MQQFICGLLGYGFAAYMYLDYGMRGLVILLLAYLVIAGALKVATDRAF
jgi:hypothetical protein